MTIRANPLTEKDVESIVSRFSGSIRKELGPLVKSVVWFGSMVRSKERFRDEVLFGSDIDVMIVFDDLVFMMSPEVITAYRVITEKVARDTSTRLHITTMALTRFWDYSLKGDPILINILRDGNAVYDAGCFGMAKAMLSTKRIVPGKEIIWTYLGRGPVSISNANYNMRQAVLDLYWSVFDAAHALLLHYGVTPENPDDIVPLLKSHVVSRNVLHQKHLQVVAEFVNTSKLIMTGDLTKVRGDSYDRYHKEAHDFLDAVKGIIGERTAR